ncbi:uncharacterized protein JCM15063_004963 [Sporobolomyces koalae]|uniref:uncharacterized protein n=1 Tax=Sporobolomyces koalae TaxID=500713 RepID=UPI00316E68D4
MGTEKAHHTPNRPQHHYTTITGHRSFRNPWPSASTPSASQLIFGGSWFGWPKIHLHKHKFARELKVLKPDWGDVRVHELEIKEDARRRNEGDNGRKRPKYLRGTWLGHAAAYVEIPLEDDSETEKESVKDSDEETRTQKRNTIKLLFDPIFSERAGPTSYTGPGRLRPPPCQAQDLPGVDAILISHNHYDHLDLNSVTAALEKWPKVKFFVPLENKAWVMSLGVDASQVYELDWWDDVQLSPRDFVYQSPVGTTLAKIEDEAAASDTNGFDRERIRFTCVPAQHNSGRSPADQGSTLWCGWVVEHLVYSGPPTITQAPAQNSNESSNEPSPDVPTPSPTASPASTAKPGPESDFVPRPNPYTSDSSGADVVSEAAEALANSISTRAKALEGTPAAKYQHRMTRKGAVYHGGDTGYRPHRKSNEVCPAFEEIGRKFGPFDLSFIPIWRGGSLGFVSAVGLRLHHENIASALHGSPSDGVDIHLDVKSRNSIGIHFGTFVGAESESLEAIIELQEAVEEAGVKTLDDPNEDEKGRMGVLDLGETYCVPIDDLVIVS